MDMSDSELIKLALSDNEPAKEELLYRCKDVMSYHLVKYKQLYFGQLNTYDVEDLVSECHIAVLESIKLYRPDKGSGFSNFAKFIIRSRLIDFLRKKSRQSRLIDFSADINLVEATVEEVTNPMDRINTSNISERDKRIIALILTGESQVDVAKIFGITKARVNQILKKCVK